MTFPSGVPLEEHLQRSLAEAHLVQHQNFIVTHTLRKVSQESLIFMVAELRISLLTFLVK